MSLVVVSAHAADFVWRSGGVIAQYVRAGHTVQIVALSYGERGESAELWKRGESLDRVKELRREESQKAADILGAPVEFWDWDDYPLRVDAERQLELVRRLREWRPEVILTHGSHDPFNPDHATVAQAVHDASVLSIAHGVLPDIPVCTQPRLFGFEHHQSELSEFHPDVLIDISAVYDIKYRAMECFQAQQHLIEYYAMRASIRGNHARRISGQNHYRYAEAFMRYYPMVGAELL